MGTRWLSPPDKGLKTSSQQTFLYAHVEIVITDTDKRCVGLSITHFYRRLIDTLLSMKNGVGIFPKSAEKKNESKKNEESMDVASYGK